jgi:hypothetical protein
VLHPESRVVSGAFVKADYLVTSLAPDRCRLYIVSVFIILQIFFLLTLPFSPLAVARDDEVIMMAVLGTQGLRHELWRAWRAMGVGRVI